MQARSSKVKEPTDLTTWTVANMTSPKQTDGHSCGLFVIMVSVLLNTN
jgi:Ulp1 family protease